MMYACVHVRMHVRVYICVYLCMHVHMHSCVFMFVNESVDVCTFLCMLSQMCVCRVERKTVKYKLVCAKKDMPVVCFKVDCTLNTRIQKLK
jgi:hypothetical protein